MRRFSYKATEKATRKTVSGVIQAESEREAGRLLVEQGYIPDRVEEEDTRSFLAKIKNKVSAKDRIIFTRQFATLIGAGLPMSRSLKTASEQATSQAMKAEPSRQRAMITARIFRSFMLNSSKMFF